MTSGAAGHAKPGAWGFPSKSDLVKLRMQELVNQTTDGGSVWKIQNLSS